MVSRSRAPYVGWRPCASTSESARVLRGFGCVCLPPCSQLQSSSGWVRALCLHPCSLLTCSALFRRTACPVHIAFFGCAGAVPASPPSLPGTRCALCQACTAHALPSASPCTRLLLVALPREHLCRHFAVVTALPDRVRPAAQDGARTSVPRPGSAYHLCLLSSFPPQVSPPHPMWVRACVPPFPNRPLPEPPGRLFSMAFPSRGSAS